MKRRDALKALLGMATVAPIVVPADNADSTIVRLHVDGQELGRIVQAHIIRDNVVHGNLAASEFTDPRNV